MNLLQWFNSKIDAFRSKSQTPDFIRVKATIDHECLEFFVREYLDDFNTKGYYDGNHIVCERNGNIYDSNGKAVLNKNHKLIEEWPYYDFVVGFNLKGIQRMAIENYYFRYTPDNYTLKYKTSIPLFYGQDLINPNSSKTIVLEYIKRKNQEMPYHYWVYPFGERKNKNDYHFCASSQYLSPQGVLYNMLYPSYKGDIKNIKTDEYIYKNSERFST
jgi:hypothetical protein